MEEAEGRLILLLYLPGAGVEAAVEAAAWLRSSLELGSDFGSQARPASHDSIMLGQASPVAHLKNRAYISS